MNPKNIFGAFTVAIALFFFWTTIVSSWAEMGALRASLAEHEQVLQERTDILEKFKAEYAKYQKVIQSPVGRTFISLIPVKKSTAELVSASEVIATRSGLQITTIQFTEEKGKPESAYETTTIILEMSGSYTALIAFLRDLESYVRILNIQSLEISQGKQPGVLAFNIRADTYFSK